MAELPNTHQHSHQTFVIDYIGLPQTDPNVHPSSSSLISPKENADLASTELSLGLGLAFGSLTPSDVFCNDPMVKKGIKRTYSDLSLNSSDLNKSGKSRSQGIFLWENDQSKLSKICHDNPPLPKDRVVGWPPIRSHRRHSNTLSTSTSQTISNVHDVDRHCAFHVKVNMDGIRIGRKVDLYSYTSYEDLLSALEEMFHSPTGQSSHFLKSREFQLTYEDKDGDWMLVGDVPWEMFVSNVRRLRIARGSDVTLPGSCRPSFH